MSQSSSDNVLLGRRYALCVGIGTYTNLINRNLRYAAADAITIAEQLADQQRGNFAVTVITEPTQATKAAIDEAVVNLLSAPDRQAEDLIVIYFSCHGAVYTPDNTFCLLPSNVALQAEGLFEPTTLIGIYDFARWFSRAKPQNIVVLLDVCHSGGAGAALQHFKLDLGAGPNFFFIGAARQDQVTKQSSVLQKGIFTHCLLRAFEQPPTKDGWLTVSQIRSFVSDDIQWFAKEHPISIQEWSVSVNPNLPLLRNPGYPELCPLPPLWNVPLQRNPFFTGQDEELVRLATMLQSDQKTALTQPQAITGLGGIGKTQLALEYAYRHRQDYHAVLWSRADTREVLISTFVTIAHLLDIPQKDEQDQLITVEAVKTWLAGRSNWLLILDNADELAMVKEFIPPAFQGHLLLTTRAQVMGGLAHKLEVETMRSETGALLLLRRAGLLAPGTPLEQASSADVTIAKELSEEMGGLPLALDQAGAYIEAVACNLQDYQQLYQTRRAELLKERGGVVPDHPESVAATWSLAFQKVEQNNPAASDLLRLCAFLHPDAIPEEIITKGAEHLGPQLQETASDPLALNKAITALRAYSLLHRDSATHTLTIHRLVQAVLKESMNEQIQHEWAERTVRAVNLAFPEVTDVTLWPQCERYLPHALVCADLISQYTLASPQAAGLLNQTASYLQDRGLYAQAEPLFQRALFIREQVLGPEHADTAQSLHHLALLYSDQGKYEQAEPLLQRALAISEKVWGAEHLYTAQSLHHLARLYARQSNYPAALPLYQQALAIREQVRGAEHADTAQSLNDLALLYYGQGDYAQALPLFQRALVIREKVRGAKHPDTARSLDYLAMLYDTQGDYAQALPLLQRALAISEEVRGAEHPDTADSLNDLAMLYRVQGEYAKAEPLLQRALAIREEVWGAEHPDIVDSLNSLALLYSDQGKYEQAEPLLQRALAISEKVWGAEHLYTTRSLNNLAPLYYGQGDYAKALPLFQRILAIREKVLGPEHPDTAQSLNHLAGIYARQGNYPAALPLYQRALAISEKVLGPEHPHTSIVRENYDALVEDMQREGKEQPQSPQQQQEHTSPNDSCAV